MTFRRTVLSVMVVAIIILSAAGYEYYTGPTTRKSHDGSLGAPSTVQEYNVTSLRAELQTALRNASALAGQIVVLKARIANLSSPANLITPKVLLDEASLSLAGGNASYPATTFVGNFSFDSYGYAEVMLGQSNISEGAVSAQWGYNGTILYMSVGLNNVQLFGSDSIELPGAIVIPTVPGSVVAIYLANYGNDAAAVKSMRVTFFPA